MTTTTPQTTEYSESGNLYMAVELSRDRWRLALSSGGERIRRVWVPAGDGNALLRQLEEAKKHFELLPETEVKSCYEAGRDGFWVHRLFTRLGIDSLVVDAASMKVSRRRRRAKTDRLDADQLLVDLVRHHRGDRDVWKMVRIPPVEAEDLRRVPRQLERLKKERRQHRARLLSLFATVGAGITPGKLNRTIKALDEVRCWDGSELGPYLRMEVEHEAERLELVNRQIRDLEAVEKNVATWDVPTGQKVHRLVQLRGIGIDSACLLVFELFGWREFHNRKEVGGIAGICGTPYNTGNSEREQGISKAGLARVRSRMVELSWLWLRNQPRSALSHWYRKRYGDGGSRARKVGTVALARKLLVQLWRYVEQGVVPPGAQLMTIQPK